MRLSAQVWAAWVFGVVNGVLLVTIGVIAFLWLTGCAAVETAETFVGDHGTVYVCDTEQGCGERDEYCWDGSERELEDLLGAACHEEGIFERPSPGVFGCAYCCGDGCPRGCNAFCGCFCP